MSPGGNVEEDEAEFVDALADCLSIGVPLAAAVESWASGILARDDNEDLDSDDEADELVPLGGIHLPAARRLIVR